VRDKTEFTEVDVIWYSYYADYGHVFLPSCHAVRQNTNVSEKHAANIVRTKDLEDQQGYLNGC
jgi:hypothetical protein